MWSKIGVSSLRELPDFRDNEFTPLLTMNVIEENLVFTLIGWTHEPKRSSSRTTPSTTVITKIEITEEEKYELFTPVTTAGGIQLILTRVGKPEESKIYLANLAQQIITKALEQRLHNRTVEAPDPLDVWTELICAYTVHVKYMHRYQVTSEVFKAFSKLLRDGTIDLQASLLGQTKSRTALLLRARI